MLAVAVTSITVAVVWSWNSNSDARTFRGGTFRIGVDHNPPIHDWSDTKGASGFVVDVLNEAANRAGVKLNWVYCPRGSKAALQEGFVDLWPVGYYRPREYPNLHQTRPWTGDQHVFVWDRDRFPEEPDSWDGTRIAIADRVATRTLTNRLFPSARQIPAPTRMEALRQMCRGSADVAFLDMRVIENALLDRPEPCRHLKFRIRALPGSTDPMSLFARQGMGPLAELLRDRIEEMVTDGTVVNYADKWFAHSSSDLRVAMRLQSRNRQLQWLTALCGLMALAIGTLVWFVRKLKSARTAADRGRQLQAEFLANVSHEIRTPMNGVLGTADLLLDTVQDAEIREQVETIRESAIGQLELLNQILDQSKIDSGLLLLETTPFSMRRLVEQIEKSFLPAARRKGIWLRTKTEGDVPALVQGDGLRIRQVLSNLVNNAIKFTPSGGVDVTVRVVITGSIATIEFIVADTGIGIPLHVQETIFEKFRQVDASTTRRYGGTGLGLSISRQLVRLMGGELTVDSELGRGSRFRFGLELTVARLAEPESPSPVPRGAVRKGLSVLLVEDNLVNQRVAQVLLTKLGARVDVATNGKEAVAKMRSGEYDAILMDCHMPEMDGYSATMEIRQLDGLARTVPIIALTAGVSGEERRKAMQSGMDGFLAKPINREELATALSTLPRRESPAG